MSDAAIAKKFANVAVIGGGYSGMAAAIRLVERGAKATVFEASRVLGGRARRIEYQGRTLDNGQHILSGAYSELLRLMALVGVPLDACDRVPLRMLMPPHFDLRAPRLPAPWHMVCALLFAKGLKWADRTSAIRFMSALKRARFEVDPTLSVSALLALHAQTPNLINFLWRPLTVSALNTPIGDASAQVFVNVLRDALAGTRAASDLLLPKIDLSALFPEPAARWLADHNCQTMTGTSVTQLTLNDHSVTVGTKDASRSFDAVVVAVAPHQRDALLPAESTNGQTAMSYQPIVTLYFGFDSGLALPTAMLGQPSGIAQWFFDRRQLSATPEQRELVVSAVVSAAGPHEALSQTELVAAVLAELRGHVPALPEPLWQKVIHEKFATFSCTPEVVRLSAVTRHSRVYLAGDDIINPSRLYPATLEGAVRNGIAAADHAVAFLQSSRPPPP